MQRGLIWYYVYALCSLKVFYICIPFVVSWVVMRWCTSLVNISMFHTLLYCCIDIHYKNALIIHFQLL